jgi:hypothetical protein
MSSCLDNIIAIDKRCSPETPSSGMYIQTHLPGVTVKLADMAADEETASGIDLINEKITLAKDQILQDVREFLAPYMRVNSVIESETVGYYHDNLETVAADVGYRKGIQVKIDHYPYLEFYINSIKLQSATSGATSIYIYNLITGKLLDTIAITTVADVPTEVIVQKAYKTDKQKLNLFIAIDGAATTYKSSLAYGQIAGNCSSCSGGYRNSYAVFNNIMISSAGSYTETNKRSTTYTSGLSINYSINCTVENFVCNMSNLFAWPILQKTGAELMRELMYSRRLNSIILIDKNMNEKMREEFDAEYVKSMERILKNVSIPDNACFKCNQKIRSVVRVP